jgi:cysteine synthase
MRYNSILDVIGNTPLVELKSFSPHPGVQIFAKLEGFNPSGSMKDRIAKLMIEEAEASGIIKPGSILLEPTSGNTGIALAMIARRLKEYNPAIRIIAAEPLQGEGVQGLRSLQDGFVPPVLDQSLLDAKILVSSVDAIRRTRQLKDQEGIFAGPSCGAALHAALGVAASREHGKIVVILADGGWKYLSEDLWTRDLDQLEDDLEAKLLW